MSPTSPSTSPSKRTFPHQANLPKLPIPPLEETCKKYLKALEALQDEKEHGATKKVVEEFLAPGGEGERAQAMLKSYAQSKDSYIEEFWYESYLSHSDPVVLALNPFFILEDDPTPHRGTQLPRAAGLVFASLGFIHDLRAELLEPDHVRGTPLDMDQYRRLFGTARVPTDHGCRMEIDAHSRHIAVIRRGQFYYFDVLDAQSRPILTEPEILRNLEAIVKDADMIPVNEVARQAVGVLSTENRKVWSHHRDRLHSNRHNADNLRVVDNSLFVVCLDDASPETEAELCANFLCGTYRLSGGVQVGTCTNRWYDKLQIIVCANGAAGINFEHTGVDGHTVLRFAADVYTEGLMLLARSINPSAPSFFHAKMSPYAKGVKRVVNGTAPAPPEDIDTTPKKLEWHLTPELRTGIRYAETRLSDLICQNDCQALEFKGYGKRFITRHGFSPDAFVQMAFQAAYFGLYGRVECTYEPAMTKAFLHGRTEAIRTVQPHSAAFQKTYFSEQTSPEEKIAALRKACEGHVKLTRECSKGLGQDRHLYALYCILQRELKSGSSGSLASNTSSDGDSSTSSKLARTSLPSIFTDPGWAVLNTSILSTSNCGNSALRLFGFGPVAADGYGIGYIIKDDGISICASSKHLQTRRFLDTLASYLDEARRLIVGIHGKANIRPVPWVDHTGTLRDGKTGHRIVALKDGPVEKDEHDQIDEDMPGYSFFDSGEVEMLKELVPRRRHNVGKRLQIAEY